MNGKVRRAKLYGRDYIVAPLSMLVPGVLNGSQGALFYPPDEVARSADIWNGTPITLNHPSANGMPVSARSPDVLNRVGLGFVFGSVFESKLSAEGWFDIEQTRRVDNRVLTALEKNQPLELSTGLFTHNEQAPAEANHNGTPYTHIARNYRADHLAVLPDSVGACSLRDGCGVLVNQTCPVCGRSPVPVSTENADNAGDKPSHFKVCDRNDKGHCMPGKGPTKDTPSEGGTMTCQCPDGTTMMKERMPSEESGSAGGKHIAVKNETQPRETDMKDQLIQYLTTNCSCWKGKQETLNKLDEPDLAAMKADHEATLASNTLVTNLRTELETVKATATANAGPRLTADEQETLAWANVERTRQKALLVERLLVNVSDPARRQAKGQALMSKPQAELQELVELLPTVGQVSPTVNYDFTKPIPNYAGAAGGPLAAPVDDDPNDFPPVVNETYPDPRDAWRQRHSA